ncbi:MAG: SpoIVB peptidase [Clostridia bacterium]|nr:SpoIVB peptidase [Clostridia bacterium]
MIKRIAVFVVAVCVLVFPCYAASVGDEVYVGGMAFGIQLYTDGVLVCGVSQVDAELGNTSPGDIAGIKKGDIITKFDSKTVSNVNDILDSLKISEGKPLEIVFTRSGRQMESTITPVRSLSEGIYKIGLWLKDGTSGIGTVTYVEDNGSFAGLGHGVCDADTGELMTMRNGITTDVTLTGVQESISGHPGQLIGILTDKNGNLSKNTISGVFGKFNDISDLGNTAVIASKDNVCEGPASILCTLDNNIICQYEITIEKINNTKDSTKNFVIRVTDDDLMCKTGGIVQGMSGSPIIQNDKLVGAVTHVFVDDPERGYGIFIENMLTQ